MMNKTNNAGSKTSSLFDARTAVTTDELARMLDRQLDDLFAHPDEASEIEALFVHGSPGCGKSSVVREVCRRRGIEFHDVRLAQMEACDVRGLPVPDREKKSMEWYVNGSWPRNPEGRGIIFLDELSAADRSIQVAAYELVLDRRLGENYSVPPGYLIVAAGNNVSDRAAATATSSALANRFTHVELVPDIDAWRMWAAASGLNPAVVGFASFRPELLFRMEGEDVTRGWPSPRSWARVARLCDRYGRSDVDLLSKLVRGTVGEGAGCEFMEFYKLEREFDDVLAAMLDPTRPFAVPEEASRKYAVSSAMVYFLWRGKDEADENARIDGFYRILSGFTSEFGMKSMFSALQAPTPAEAARRAKKLQTHPSFAGWAEQHARRVNSRFSL